MKDKQMSSSQLWLVQNAIRHFELTLARSVFRVPTELLKWFLAEIATLAYVSRTLDTRLTRSLWSDIRQRSSVFETKLFYYSSYTWKHLTTTTHVIYNNFNVLLYRKLIEGYKHNNEEYFALIDICS